MPLSGPQWVTVFARSRSLNDLAEPFRTNATRFLAALRDARAHVTVSDTLRRPQRAYLMHYSFAIARQSLDPAAVPPMAGVDIQWVHFDATGKPDPLTSRAAAARMVEGFGVVFPPVLQSRHIEGLAIDMAITWSDNLVIAKADGSMVTISSLPREGAHNAELHAVGAGYGVVKLVADALHWSSDGH